jgi:hypothetical protein
MKVFNCPQGSGEWKSLRLGIPTASEFDSIMTPEFKLRTGQTPETYLYKKLCEKLLGFSPDIDAFAIEQGVILEKEARPYYEFTFNTPVQLVGFCTTDDGRVGCSPDGLIGEDGGIEIKCPQPHTHLRYLLEGGLPKDYMAQVHGSMYVTGRPYWMFMSYSRQFQPLLIRVERDERIQSMIHQALEAFLDKFEDKYATIKAARDADNAIKEADFQRLHEAELAKARAASPTGELPGEKWLRENGRIS